MANQNIGNNINNGIIRPQHWKNVRNKELFIERNEKSFSNNENDLLAISEYYGVALKKDKVDSTETITRADSLDGYKVCKKNDLAMNIMLAWKGALGISDFDGIVSPSYCVFTPQKYIYPRYFHYLYRTDYYKGIFKCYSTGIIDSRLRLYPEKFLSLHTTIPPFPEQKKIVDFLDEKVKEIDNAIENIKITIDLLEKLQRTYIIKIVTGKAHKCTKDTKEWFDKIPSHWNTPKIKYMANVSSGGTPSRDFPEYWGGNIGWIKTGELQNNEISNAEEYITNEGLKNSSAKIFKKDTILVAMYGQGKTRGMTALLKNEMSTNQACAGIEIKSDKLIPKYLQIALMAGYEALRSEAIGSGQPNLNGTLIEDFKIPLPPVEEQKSIINQYNNITSSFSSLMKSNKKLLYRLETYKKSLIYEYVTGKKEVK